MKMHFIRCVLVFNFFKLFFVLSKLLDAEDESYEFLNDENEIDLKAGLTVEEEEIIFKYYNRDFYSGKRIYIKNITDENLKGWRKYSELKIITHGWLSSDQSLSVDGIKNAYLKTKNINVITVDWSESASWKPYPLPAYFTKQVGAIIAKLIDELVGKNYVTLENVHVIGHSLGSHVAGATGSSVKTGPIGRITGLDPAGPAFEFVHYMTSNVLDVSDGKFVDIIHTAGGAAGYLQPMGHADFYPNGGIPPQPGCLETNSVNDAMKSFSCSHGRAYDFFADSIMNPQTYRAYQCDSWDALKNRTCNSYPVVYMGDETSHDTKGIFYLSTKASAPFGNGP